MAALRLTFGMCLVFAFCHLPLAMGRIACPSTSQCGCEWTVTVACPPDDGTRCWRQCCACGAAVKSPTNSPVMPSTSMPSTSAAPSLPKPNLSEWSEGTTSRYWDCCKPSCAWPNKFNATSPLKVCDLNGSAIKNIIQSSCGGKGEVGGPAYACTALQPTFDKATNTSFLFAAASLPGLGEMETCCGCFELAFDEPHSAGRVVVQVTGQDPGHGNISHFNLLIPGGGFGYHDSCSHPGGHGPPQFPDVPSSSWGERYGGLYGPGHGDAKVCDGLPAAVQPGCRWYFARFGLDNPTMKFRRVPCLAMASKLSGCVRADEPHATPTAPDALAPPAPTAFSQPLWP